MPVIGWGLSWLNCWVQQKKTPHPSETEPPVGRSAMVSPNPHSRVVAGVTVISISSHRLVPRDLGEPDRPSIPTFQCKRKTFSRYTFKVSTVPCYQCLMMPRAKRGASRSACCPVCWQSCSWHAMGHWCQIRQHNSFSATVESYVKKRRAQIWSQIQRFIKISTGLRRQTCAFPRTRNTSAERVVANLITLEHCRVKKTVSPSTPTCWRRTPSFRSRRNTISHRETQTQQTNQKTKDGNVFPLSVCLMLS